MKKFIMREMRWVCWEEQNDESVQKKDAFVSRFKYEWKHLQVDIYI